MLQITTYCNSGERDGKRNFESWEEDGKGECL